MKPAAIFTLVCWGLAGVTLAQQPAPPDVPAPPPAARESSHPTGVETEAEQASPPDKEPMEARVRRLLEEFDQRHDQRVLEMYSYGKAGNAEPGLKQFADPRQVEVELKDEQDREETSKALAKEYAEEARRVQNQEKALQNFIAKRQKTLDDMSKRASTVNRQDLEVAAENLARQPGADAQVQEIRRRLDQDARDAKELSTQQSLAQQEAASAQDELKQLGALEESLTRESKAYTADAASAHQNQLHLADRLEFYVVNAQAEDVLDQGRKATAAVHHLAPSPLVQDTLGSLGPREKVDAKPEPAKKYADTPNDEKGCPERAAQPPKE
jgi:vacuolar-type H+-ATPase subunit I/STV1